jgi:hypothetical protein
LFGARTHGADASKPVSDGHVPSEAPILIARPHMKRITTFLLVGGMLALPAVAQDANKIANFLHSTLDARSKEIIAATVAMPADRFGAKPTPEDTTFALLTLHVADTNYLYCSKIGAVAEPVRTTLADTESKLKLVERLKDSFDFCASSLGRIADLNKSDTLVIGGAKTSRAMAILSLTGTWSDHAAMQARYATAAATASK